MTLSIVAVEELVINEEDLQAFESVNFEPIQLNEGDFVPDFNKSCDENFTRERQMLGAAYSTYPTLMPFVVKLEYTDPKSCCSNPDAAEEHAMLEQSHDLFKGLKQDVEVTHSDPQEKCSIIKLPVAEEEDKYETPYPKGQMIPSSNSELEDAEIHVEDNSAKEVRWGRKDDKQLFEALRFIQSKYVFDITILERLKAPSSSPELTELANMIGWKGSMKRLIRRIKNVGKPRELSVREFKRLKRVIKTDYLGREIDYDALLYEFPGKT